MLDFKIIKNIGIKELYANIKNKLKNITPFQVLFGVIIVTLITSAIFYGVRFYNINKIANKNEKYNITKNMAEEYYYNADYTKAIAEYKLLDKKDTSSPWTNLSIANIYSVKGDFYNSRLYLAKAKQLLGKDSEALNYFVFTEFMNKDYTEALKDGENYLKLFPSNKNLIKTMFTVYMANNQLSRAKTLISTYKVDAKSAYDISEFARMLMIANDNDNGFSQLRKAWDINKDEIKIYDVLAQISTYKNDWILQYVSNLSTKSPNEACYKMWIAKIYSLKSDTADDALKILDSIKSENTGKIEIKLIQAAILENTKREAEGDLLIKQVIKDNSNNYSVLHAAGWYYLNKKDYKSAEMYCRQSILNNRNYPDNYGFLMPEILKSKGLSLEGEPYFRTAMLKEPYNYNIMLSTANFYLNTTKNTTKALEYFKLAEIIQPNDPEIKYNMAIINLSNNKNDDAILLLKECIKLSDSVPKYHRTLGTIYMVNGDLKGGLTQIKYAFNSDENDILTLNNAGCYYITGESNLQRGLFNLQKAAEGINSKTDKYTSDTIKANYAKAKKLNDDFQNGTDNETIKIPDFVLFY